jgi:hypothetical protein
MSKKRLARMIQVYAIAIMLIGVIVIFPSCSPTATTPTLVTYNCTTSTTTYITAKGEVTKTGGSLLSRRGFVYMEGTAGDPVLNSVNLSNPSFESGDPPEGWTYRNSTQVSRVSDAKVGSYSLKYEYPGGGSYPYVMAQQTFNNTEWAGKTLTVGAWVRSNSANTRLGFMELGGSWWTNSTGGTSGDGQWHWLMCTATIPASLTANWTIAVFDYTTTASYTFWVDDVVLVENGVFDVGSFDIGNYTLNIKNLKSATSYRIRAFGENDKGISYGNTVTCQTR